MTASTPDPAYIKKEPRVGRPCVHCQRLCGTLAGGFARISGQAVCSKPTEPDRPDCYRMIMVKFHPVRNCPHCMDTTQHESPAPPRNGLLGLHGI